eukprot:9479425-Pyramimonas_sp.AAC.1
MAKGTSPRWSPRLVAIGMGSWLASPAFSISLIGGCHDEKSDHLQQVLVVLLELVRTAPPEVASIACLQGPPPRRSRPPVESTPAFLRTHRLDVRCHGRHAVSMLLAKSASPLIALETVDRLGGPPSKISSGRLMGRPKSH